VQQGNNMLQTAEGAMNEIGNILGRMRELAVQSASDGVNSDDRASIDLEYEQLKSEITRLASATEYNDTKLIDGTKAKTGTAGNVTNNKGLTSNDTTGINITSTAKTGTYAFSSTAAGKLKLIGDSDTGGAAQEVVVAGNGAQEVQFDELGITLKLNADFDTSTDANNSTLQGVAITVEGIAQDITLQVGSNNVEAEDQIKLNLGSTTAEGLGISTSDLSDLGNSQKAINQLDAAIAKINDERSNVGSLQNRLEFTSSNLMNSIQNNSASMSTIRDADFAVEAADLARNQILTQSGSAMLAQANSLSQNVLSLIR
jgi:flagellin